MRQRMKSDELRFRHAANDNPGATLEQLAAQARVPIGRARSLHKRWLGVQAKALPPLPQEPEATDTEPESPAAASESPNPPDKGPADAYAAPEPSPDPASVE